jgi:hypothetical protein
MSSAVLLTVDWEKDSAAWRAPGHEVDYGGVLVGTQVLCNLLDRFSIPCTWLVECHSDEPAFNLPTRFPKLVTALAARPRDEVGVHLHWARRLNNTWCYPVHDVSWISQLLRGAVADLTGLGIRPLSFRGGAFLRVPRLSEILSRHGFKVDSTSFRANTATWPPSFWYRVSTRLALLWPSFLRPQWRGEIVHLPVAANIGSLATSTALRVWLDAALSVWPGPKVCVLYVHIHQLTTTDSRPDGDATIDSQFVTNLSRVLQALAQRRDIQFMTMRAVASTCQGIVDGGDD